MRQRTNGKTVKKRFMRAIVRQYHKNLKVIRHGCIQAAPATQSFPDAPRDRKPTKADLAAGATDML